MTWTLLQSYGHPSPAQRWAPPAHASPTLPSVGGQNSNLSPGAPGTRPPESIRPKPSEARGLHPKPFNAWDLRPKTLRGLGPPVLIGAGWAQAALMMAVAAACYSRCVSVPPRPASTGVGSCGWQHHPEQVGFTRVRAPPHSQGCTHLRATEGGGGVQLWVWGVGLT